MNIIVRKYEEKDYETVNKILMESFDLKKSTNNSDCIELVATNDNDVLGYLVLTKVYDCVKGKYYMLMDYVCVDSKFRRLGVGKEMVNYALNYCEKEKVMYLALSSRTSRVEAHKLYESCGLVRRDSYLYRKEFLWL